MSRVRFITARDLFEAYPTASEDMAAPPDDRPSLDYLRSLIVQSSLEDAVTFAAYLLPRREAVWWGCQSVRSFGEKGEVEDGALQAAEAWVKTPEEKLRLEAMSIGSISSRSFATTWLALAAAWSGGSLTSSEQAPVPAPPHLTAKAVRAAILIGAAKAQAANRKERLVSCLENGVRLAGGEALSR